MSICLRCAAMVGVRMEGNGTEGAAGLGWGVMMHF